MKRTTFLRFAAPSVLLMLLLLAAPLVMTVMLSWRHCQPVIETRGVELSTPFGVESLMMHVVKLDGQGQPMVQCGFAGLLYYKQLLGWTDRSAEQEKSASALKPAVAFTLRYVAITTPVVVGLGLLLACAVTRLRPALRALCITASMIPFVLTPVVGALLFKWLFRDGGLVPGLLQPLGLEVHWMAHPWTAEAVVVAYGVWQTTPFAFIVFYAGLLALPREPIEAAQIDGATPAQIFRLVLLPQLGPLLLFVAIILVMDAYRVFEPVLVLTQGAFSVSVQYLAYQILLVEQNVHKASAAAVLTIVGVAVLLWPMVRRTWRDHRSQGAA